MKVVGLLHVLLGKMSPLLTIGPLPVRAALCYFDEKYRLGAFKRSKTGTRTASTKALFGPPNKVYTEKTRAFCTPKGYWFLMATEIGLTAYEPKTGTK